MPSGPGDHVHVAATASTPQSRPIVAGTCTSVDDVGVATDALVSGTVGATAVGVTVTGAVSTVGGGSVAATGGSVAGGAVEASSSEAAGTVGTTAVGGATEDTGVMGVVVIDSIVPAVVVLGPRSDVGDTPVDSVTIAGGSSFRPATNAIAAAPAPLASAATTPIAAPRESPRRM